MFNIKRLFVLLIIISAVCIPVFTVYAAKPTVEYNCKDQNPNCEVGGIFDPGKKVDVNCACCGDCELANITRVAVRVSNIILGLVGSAALLMFIYGGITWITSAGNKERVDKGRRILTGAVIGVIIVLGAYMLVNFTVQVLTGKNIEQLQSGDWGQPATKK